MYLQSSLVKLLIGPGFSIMAFHAVSTILQRTVERKLECQGILAGAFTYTSSMELDFSWGLVGCIA